MNYVPEKYEHRVRYYDYYSNRARGERRKAKQHDAEPAHADERPIPAIDEATGDPTKRAHWARLIKKVYEVDPLECPRCAAPMRLIALIEKPDIVERILKHLNRWRLSYRPVQKENVRFGLRCQLVDATH